MQGLLKIERNSATLAADSAQIRKFLQLIRFYTYNRTALLQLYRVRERKWEKLETLFCINMMF